MELLSNEAVRNLLLFAPVFILSLSFHEYAHGWMAYRLGDSTAKYLGRLTMDPMAHIDWVGTVIFPALAILTGAPLFGWAKPVPIDARNFRHSRRGMALSSAAGPLSNILLAILVVAILSGMVRSLQLPLSMIKDAGGMQGALVEMLMMALQLNLFLAFFNLIPIPPLDGSRILQGIVPSPVADRIDSFESMGSWILLLLFFSGVLRLVAAPVYMFMTFLLNLFKVPF